MQAIFPWIINKNNLLDENFEIFIKYRGFPPVVRGRSLVIHSWMLCHLFETIKALCIYLLFNEFNSYQNFINFHLKLTLQVARSYLKKKKTSWPNKKIKFFIFPHSSEFLFFVNLLFFFPKFFFLLCRKSFSKFILYFNFKILNVKKCLSTWKKNYQEQTIFLLFKFLNLVFVVRIYPIKKIGNPWFRTINLFTYYLYRNFLKKISTNISLIIIIILFRRG